MDKRLKIAIEAALEAGKAIMKVYSSTQLETQTKEDDSPLTAADLASNNVINQHLQSSEHPIISEENRNRPYEIRKNWDSCWIVDPLDGTKEFIKRNGEFTVNIALCKSGQPVLGVIYVPTSKELYFADTTTNVAYKHQITGDHEMPEKLGQKENRIQPANPVTSTVRVVGSKSHMNNETQQYISGLEQQHNSVSIVSKGSSLKFCLVAEGKADIYPRFAPTMEWDTAAGQAICNAVGLKVLNQETNKPLLYNKENLLNPHFLVTN